MMHLDRVAWKGASEKPFKRNLKMLTQGQRSCCHVGQHLGVSAFEKGFEMKLAEVSLLASDWSSVA